MTEPSESSSNCPFCDKPVSAAAIVCGSCGARKGYGTNGQVVQNKGEATIGVAIGGVFIAVCLVLGLGSGNIWGIGMGLLFAGITYFYIADRIKRLTKGPAWYRAR